MRVLFSVVFLLTMIACSKNNHETIHLLDKKAFETTYQGKQISLFTLETEKGIKMQVSNFGGRIISLWIPDKQGYYEDVVMGYPSIEDYIHPKGERFLGPVVGRYANRIANGTFELDGVKYTLPINNNGQTLHGGLNGLDMVVWNVDEVTKNQIKLSYLSPDGDEGFPGNLTLKMIYTLTANNELKIEYEAVTDKPTVVNLSHHGIFNLKGQGNGTILGHDLVINASNITPVDSVLIPTGQLMPVDNTPFDFRVAHAIGERIGADHLQLKHGGGYDHNWAIDRKTDSEIEFIASLYEPSSGRFMEVFSDQPGVQFYSGNFFDGKVNGKYGKALNYREGIALETQFFPDSPNQPNFPSTRLNPDMVYKQTCIYKFSTK